jgi:glycosyltransferase involved in cell wall biosynthesis
MKSVLVNNGFGESRVRVIPYFTHLPEIEKKISFPDEPTILFLGRIVKGKGVYSLLRAFAKVRERSRLIMIGDGPDLEGLISLAKKLNVSSRISFPGWLFHDQIDRYYRTCTMVIVPSIWTEAFGIVGIEGMSYSKPVIGFDVGGISEWLKDGKTGFLVTPGDEAELKGKIELLIQDRKLATELGERGREDVKRLFLPAVHMTHLLSVFKEAMACFKPERSAHA